MDSSNNIQIHSKCYIWILFLKDNNEIKKVLKKLHDFDEELNFSIEKDLYFYQENL